MSTALVQFDNHCGVSAGILVAVYYIEVPSVEVATSVLASRSVDPCPVVVWWVLALGVCE